MSQRFPGGILGVGFNPLLTPNAPTIGTATNAGSTSVSVAFTAPANVGGSAITSYAAQSTPGGVGASGASSPITVSGLTTGTPYTFRVAAINSYGPSVYSAASNSATPALIQGQQAYVTPGTYSWVAPAGVTSISVVCVGGGGQGISIWLTSLSIYNSASGSGGGLGWKNNISVTPGASYTVVVGNQSQDSYFINTSTVKGGAGSYGGFGGDRVGDGGGDGGYYAGGANAGGGGGGGYTGTGGNGNGSPIAGSGGAGAGGSTGSGRGGGGVGILGQGTSGTTSGQGGSGGSNGTVYNGGVYGGGGASGPNPSPGPGNPQIAYGTGGGGAVRIIWPGNTRLFPSTNTGNV